MKSQRVSTHEASRGNPPRARGSALPDWRQVSAQHRQELMVTLAAMIVKQLGASPAPGRGESDER
jgi:hypothetical protein